MPDESKGTPGLLSLEQAEHWGQILTCGTGDAEDVAPEVILGLLRDAYRSGAPVGLDTEFSTDDIDRSGAYRAVVQLMSLGIPGDARRSEAPVAQRVVLGSGALPAFDRWLQSDHTKLLYNAPADLHPIQNAGLTLNAWHDIFPFSRFLRPDSKTHGLKFHIQYTLGYAGLGEYADNFYRFKVGAKGLPTKKREPIPLAELVPGHPLWARMKAYAALDAKATVELAYVWRTRYGFRW